LDPSAVSTERSALLSTTSTLEGRLLGALAAALAPGHASWVAPTGTADAVARASDALLTSRASALRAGPLRVAVLAHTGTAQAQAAVQAVDRWIARRPGELRACSPVPTPLPPRPGTYSVELVGGGASEALLAWPLPPGDDAVRAQAQWLAAALEGGDGLLAR